MPASHFHATRWHMKRIQRPFRICWRHTTCAFPLSMAVVASATRQNGKKSSPSIRDWPAFSPPSALIASSLARLAHAAPAARRRKSCARQRRPSTRRQKPATIWECWPAFNPPGNRDRDGAGDRHHYGIDRPALRLFLPGQRPPHRSGDGRTGHHPALWRAHALHAYQRPARRSHRGAAQPQRRRAGDGRHRTPPYLLRTGTRHHRLRSYHASPARRQLQRLDYRRNRRFAHHAQRESKHLPRLFARQTRHGAITHTNTIEVTTSIGTQRPLCCPQYSYYVIDDKIRAAPSASIEERPFCWK